MKRSLMMIITTYYFHNSICIGSERCVNCSNYFKNFIHNSLPGEKKLIACLCLGLKKPDWCILKKKLSKAAVHQMSTTKWAFEADSSENAKRLHLARS